MFALTKERDALKRAAAAAAAASSTSAAAASAAAASAGNAAGSSSSNEVAALRGQLMKKEELVQQVCVRVCFGVWLVVQCFSSVVICLHWATHSLTRPRFLSLPPSNSFSFSLSLFLFLPLTQLMDEGQKLSKRQLELEGTVKKLRGQLKATEGDRDKLSAMLAAGACVCVVCVCVCVGVCLCVCVCVCVGRGRWGGGSGLFALIWLAQAPTHIHDMSHYSLSTHSLAHSLLSHTTCIKYNMQNNRVLRGRGSASSQGQGRT